MSACAQSVSILTNVAQRLTLRQLCGTVSFHQLLKMRNRVKTVLSVFEAVFSHLLTVTGDGFDASPNDKNNAAVDKERCPNHKLTRHMWCCGKF